MKRENEYQAIEAQSGPLSPDAGEREKEELMLKNISGLGWCYFTYSVLACGYFCAAAIGGWKFPDLLDDGGGSYSGSGSSYSGGSTYGRSSGGFGGGGK